MFDEAELRRMSPKERARLMQALAVLDMPRLATAGNPRRRRLFLIGTIVCCVALAVWIGVLVVTLPRFYRAGDWDPINLNTAFADEKERARLFGYMGALTNERIIADAAAYIDFLLARPEVRGEGVGTPLAFERRARGGELPRQGTAVPWRLHQNYLLDRRLLSRAPIEDEALEFAPHPPASRAIERPARMAAV